MSSTVLPRSTPSTPSTTSTATSSLPLELYEVLEEEYLSMYGPLAKPAAGEVTVLDCDWAMRILQECSIQLEPKETVEQRLTAIVTGTGKLDALRQSPAMTDHGVYLLDNGNLCDHEIRRKVVDEAFTGAIKPLREVRLENVYSAIHKREKPRTALCISGGGIRSATFALGVIQGLATSNILDKFDYLSTVSGGGYIGSWLSSWTRRHRDGISGVKKILQNADTATGATQPAITDNMVPREVPNKRDLPERKVFPEPEPIKHLREYSNYLSPSLNLFSADIWTLASLYLRNLLLNLLVLIPLLAFVLAIPRMFSYVLEWGANGDPLLPQVWSWSSAALITYAFAYLGWTRPVVSGRKAKGFTQTRDGVFVLNCILPLLAGAVAMAIFYARAIEHELLRNVETFYPAIAAAVGMTLFPWLLYYVRYYKATDAERRSSHGAERKGLRKQGIELLAVVVALATSAAVLFLLAKKVFPDPIRDVPTTATLAPIDRVFAVSSPQAQLYVCLAVPLIMLVFFVQASIFVGLSGLRNEDNDREWWGRAGGWLLLFTLLLAVGNLISVFGPIAFYYAPVILGATGGIAGIVAAVFGFSDKTSAKQTASNSKTSTIASALSVPLFIVALLAAISLSTTWLAQQFSEDPKILKPEQYATLALMNATVTQSEETGAGTQKLETKAEARVSMPALQAVAHLQTVQYTTLKQIAIFFAVAGFAMFLSLFIGTNKFSMAALYRNRIMRAYLGASRYNRDPDQFTGFDENDNLQMWELRPELLWSANIRDAKGLVDIMKKPGETVPNRLWGALDEKTQNALTESIDGAAIDALVLNLNALVMDGNLPTILQVDAPDWVTTTDTQLPYPAAIRNRATLDAHFSTWIDRMAPPADVKNAPAGRGARAPMHVVNTALNLTTGEKLAWQQRKACAFSVSPLHTGHLGLGYRSSREYGGEDGISLGTAVGISGAAASPNMGYHSSTPMAFLMTFFNIRLGAWLGNPGPRGATSYNKEHPTTNLIPLWSELTGSTNDSSKWVYLSDGGHFENLGLYEMVVRRCHEIVLSDGGCDPACTFEDLANAIRKIRIDLGIPIDIESIKTMRPRGENGQPAEGSYVLTATIRYDAVDANARPGRITYIKPGVYDGSFFPIDVYHYAMTSQAFPHEPTSDQFFSESQFESYRALGRHAVDSACGNVRVTDSVSGAKLPIAKTFNDVAAFNKAVKPTAPVVPGPKLTTKKATG